MEIQTKETIQGVRIPEGLYHAVLKKIKDNGMKTFAATSGKPEHQAKQIILEFDVISMTKEGKDIVTNLAFFGYAPATKNNKLGQALEALGANLTDKFIDTDKLLLKQCRVMVEDYTKNNEKFSCITKVKQQE